MSSRKTLGILTAAFAGILFAGATSAHAVLLVDEDFQSPLYANNTSNPAFGFNFNSINLTKSRRSDNQSDFPGDQNIPNQGIQFEWTNAEGWWDVLHNWSSGDQYILTLNASPQSWNGTQVRYIRPSIREQDNTVLWAAGEDATTLLPVYNNFGRNPWTAAQTFSWTVDASTFTTGTEGSGLRLYLDSSGFRGLYVDNVTLELIPEPASLALLGLGGLMIVRRRR